MDMVAVKFRLCVSLFIVGEEGVATIVVWAGGYATVVREDCAGVGRLINVIDCGLWRE